MRQNSRNVVTVLSVLILVAAAVGAPWVLDPWFVEPVPHLVSCAVLVGLGVALWGALSRARRRERLLRRSGGELSDFLENATVALHSVGSDAIIQWANQAELDLLGYEREEYVGRPITAFHADQAAIDGILARLQQGEEVRDEPARLRSRDGSIKEVRISSSPVFADGELVRTRCFTLDVTDRRRAEEAQARLAAIVEASADAIVSKTLDGTIQSWNAGAERTFGYTAGEAVGRSIELIVPPDLRVEEQSLLERLRRGERIDHFETRRVTKDGRYIDVSLAISPIRDSSGRIIGASKVARDVSERKRSDQVLRESEARYRALVESQSELVCRYRRDGTILFANGAYARARGVPPEALVGRDFWDFVPAEDRAEVAAMLDGLTPQEPEVDRENRFETKEGKRWILWTTRALAFDEAGRMVEGQSAGIDITDRKLAESALLEADRRKTEFLAVLAHELRNPLAPIRNAVELMKLDQADDDLVREARDTIDRQLVHMVRLVDDLVDVSRVTRDKLELRRTRVELAQVVRQAVETCSPLAERHGHTVDVGLPRQAIWLDADPVRLTQVFGNLLDNACKYTPPGGMIRLDVERQGSEALVTVTDSGIGIPSDELETVFDMFAQARSGLGGSGGGLGIGLTLVKRLVELHGGSIQVRSAGAGEGSEFVVRLPILFAAGTAATSTRENSTRSTFPRRILVVDDNEDSARSLGRLLELAGHRTWTAHDGLGAVEMAETVRPDVVLLDLGLPGMDGFEACRRIRGRDWGRSVTLVACTGWGQDDDRRRSREVGFDAHLVKPIEPDDLDQVLGHPRQPGAGEGRPRPG